MEGNDNKVCCLPLRGSGCQKGGWQAHSPVLGCYGAGAGPRARFPELLSRLCPRPTHFLCREDLEAQGLGREDRVFVSVVVKEQTQDVRKRPWFSRCSLEGGRDRCIPGHCPRGEQQTQLGGWIVVREEEG